jgi:hypothetical protein
LEYVNFATPCIISAIIIIKKKEIEGENEKLEVAEHWIELA